VRGERVLDGGEDVRGAVEGEARLEEGGHRVGRRADIPGRVRAKGGRERRAAGKWLSEIG
jgi:hypothetical protein